MILTNANIRIDHLGRPKSALDALFADKTVLMHPFVLGEIARGSIGGPRLVLAKLAALLDMIVAVREEVLALIKSERSFGRGIGDTGAHPLASVRLTTGVRRGTRDKRLHVLALDLGLAADLG